MSATLAIVGSNLCADVPFSVALRTDAGLFVQSAAAKERADLASMCDQLCRHHAVTSRDLDEVRVDVGPGSYTGLRVAVTFVRFLQRFSGLRVQAVDSLAVLARHACVDDEGPVRTLLDARRGRYHTALHELVAGEVVEREPASAAATEDVLRRIGSDELVVAPAPLAEALAQELAGRCAGVRAAREVTAEALFAPGLPWFEASAEDLEPRYLMASYAED